MNYAASIHEHRHSVLKNTKLKYLNLVFSFKKNNIFLNIRTPSYKAGISYSSGSIGVSTKQKISDLTIRYLLKKINVFLQSSRNIIYIFMFIHTKRNARKKKRIIRLAYRFKISILLTYSFVTKAHGGNKLPLKRCL